MPRVSHRTIYVSDYDTPLAVLWCVIIAAVGYL
jgi:hypothetical protein